MTPRLPVEQIQNAVEAWAKQMLVSESSLNASAYMRWARDQSPRAPSISTVLSRLGARTWADLVLSYNDHLAPPPPDGAVVELPFRCRSVGVRWERADVDRWSRDVACACSECKAPSIAERYPGLVSRLAASDDQWRPATARVRWRCDGASEHRVVTAPAEDVAAAGVRCKSCMSAEALYGRYREGDALPPRPGWTPVSALDVPVGRAISEELSDVEVSVGGSILLGRGDWWRGLPWIQPSITLPALKVAVELGAAHRDPSRHALLDRAGWRVIGLDAAGGVDEVAAAAVSGLRTVMS